jgi:hypothetical protein
VKRFLIALFGIAVALSAFADDRAVKRALIAEIIELIDAKALTQASFDIVFNQAEESMRAVPRSDESEAAAAARKEEQQQMARFRERLFARVDYARFSDEIYVPLFDEHYNIDELRELLAFYKTKTGQKSVKLLPELAVGGLMKGSVLLQEAAAGAAEEMQKEQAQKHPERIAMADIRTIATVVEARATDEDDYPNVDLNALRGLVEPTYVKKLPLTDPWGTPYVYVGNGKQYRIASAGSDKRFEWNARQFEPNEVPARLTDGLDADIVFQDGRFIQSPRQVGPQE